METMTATPTRTELRFAWLEKPWQFDEVAEIEQLCFQFPWSKQDFIRTLKQKEFVGMVVEVGEKKSVEIIGYMVYELYKGRIELMNLAVHPSVWRRGVGRAMIEKLKAKLTPNRRRAITAIVREHNTDAHEFFKAVGFKARGVIQHYYPQEDTSEDGYLFRYRYEERKKVGRD